MNSEEGTEALGKWDLSTDRANAARRKVVQSGVDDHQICKVSGFADTVPMPGYGPEAEINRRVTVLLKLKESLKGMTTTAANNTEDDTHSN
jgi:chemotaxis protein MotB